MKFPLAFHHGLFYREKHTAVNGDIVPAPAVRFDGVTIFFRMLDAAVVDRIPPFYYQKRLCWKRHTTACCCFIEDLQSKPW